MIQQRFRSLTSHLGFIVFAIGIALATSESCNAQLLRDLNRIEVQQYAPDDPQTQGRLFNLQTGHAGAFYNCDGEESKRNSPYICWKAVQHERWHGTFRDVLNWCQDRNEIAQRICDGAKGCCSGDRKSESCESCELCERSPVAQESVPACGCPSCLAASQRSIGVGENTGLLSTESSGQSMVAPTASLLDRFRAAKPSLR